MLGALFAVILLATACRRDIWYGLPCHTRGGTRLSGWSVLLPEATLVRCHSAAEVFRSRVTTPALVYDQGRLGTLAGVARRVRDQCGARVLYAVKACAFSPVLQTLAPSLDGFAVSSLFEARLVRDLYPGSPLHLTTPGLRDDEIDELAELCSFVSFNSESQLRRFGPRIHRHTSVGLRVNTLISNVGDPRYDPAQPSSKLGVPLHVLPELLAAAPTAIQGLHFHTNADSEDLGQLEANVEALVGASVGLERLAWVNFGGGYLFEDISTYDPLARAVALVKQDLGCDVFVEPGAGLVRAAGQLIASVIDMFDRDGLQVAVLDTSVNHLPEVLEFGYQPEVEGSVTEGGYEYLLAGSSCLAGDVFGKYRFGSPLTTGTTITFIEAGAYAQAKSHRFNGINLPSVWVTHPDGSLRKYQSPGYESYLQHWMPNA